VSPDFLARVNARIDETAGWLGLADFRVWTLRLVPAAAAIAVIAILWPGNATTTLPVTVPVPTAQVQSFSPASETDWQREMSGNALLEAAFHPVAAEVHVR
jgi:hypothetical protein